MILRHRSQQFRQDSHGQGAQPARANRVILTITLGAADVAEGNAAGSRWVPGQTEPNLQPRTAVTSTGKLHLQLLLIINFPNYIISSLSSPISQEGWAPLCSSHIIAMKYTYLPENSKFRCSKVKNSYIQLKEKAVASLIIYHHVQIPIQRMLTLTYSSSCRVVSRKAQLHRKSV